MKAPPLLLGAALLFWGWQTGQLWLGALLGAVIEAPGLLPARWQFSQSDLDRVWNLCVALFLGATIYTFASADNLSMVGDLLRENSSSSRLATLNQSKRSLFQLLQWLPLMFLPIVLAQVYSQQDRMDLSTFSWWLRRRRGEWQGGATPVVPLLNVSYPFFACCLFAASAASPRSLWFSAGLMGLLGWALWIHRSHSFQTTGWITSLVLALALGFALQLGLLQVQKLLQRLDETLLAQWGASRGFDANESQTRIGAIGQLKLSGRIVLRVDSHGQPPPPLLRQASYDVFTAPTWTASKRDFEKVTPEANQSTWILHSAPEVQPSATIAGYLRGGAGLLALPHGVARLDDLPAINVATNLFGAVRVEDAPGFVQLETAVQESISIDSTFAKEDIEVPPLERPGLQEVGQSLGLDQTDPGRALRQIEQFFSEHFSYSLWLGEPLRATAKRTALARFLLERRSGHCEYFATATVLLLRSVGIPARYATGYSVQEKKGRYHVIRERHAHAWCLAWINGAWRNVDTTPASWNATESNRASFWEPIRDFFSRGWFEFSRWRWGHAEWKRYLLWLVAPVLVFVLARLFLQKQWSRTRHRRSTILADGQWPGLDSEFYAVEHKLSQLGLGRQQGETGIAWLERIRNSGAMRVDGIQELLAWHYRLRFDPVGLGPDDRAALRAAVSSWLANPTISTQRLA